MNRGGPAGSKLGALGAARSNGPGPPRRTGGSSLSSSLVGVSGSPDLARHILHATAPGAPAPGTRIPSRGGGRLAAAPMADLRCQTAPRPQACIRDDCATLTKRRRSGRATHPRRRFQPGESGTAILTRSSWLGFQHGLNSPPRLGSRSSVIGQSAATSSRRRRLARNSSRSNGSPVFMTRKSIGVSFRARAATALVRHFPLRSSIRR